MGVGKSSIGRPLAKLLGKEFIDSDQAIEERTGVSISLIFDIEGEAGFRKREVGILQELARKENIVLATGGGSILCEKNRQVFRKSGVVVYLCATVETLLERTRGSKHRPLLQTECPRTTLERLMTQRDPIYRQEADLIVITDRRSPMAVAGEITKLIQDR